ncbi:MAG TPA: choice-of-anchor B family protein [Longimicrobiales bacterium]|nr:choice-of-anchor B family protein [Longimicrobiales bacterium]
MKRIAAGAFLALVLGVAPVQAQGNYGSVVAAGDGVVFVGAPNNVTRPGAVHIYTAGADGQWAELAKLNSPDAQTADRFGGAIAAHGTMLLVGQSTSGGGRGAAHIYERRGGQWQHVSSLVPSDGGAADSAGVAVALGSDIAVVGASGGAGAVHVFRRGANGTWTREAKLTAPDGQAGDGFGTSVAVSGTRILVGAPLQASRRGGAYVFDRGADGQWTLTSALVARTVKEGDALGARVALMRDWAVVSAPGRDEATGAVYLFERNPNPQPNGPTWAAYTRLFPYEGSSNSGFGSSINAVGDELWVGAPGTDGGLGAVYRFMWNGERNDWTTTRKLSNVPGPNNPPTPAFSIAMAVAGGIAVAGLPFDDQGEGTAMVLARNTAGEWLPVNKVWTERESFPAMTGRPVDCNNGQAGPFGCSSNMQLQGFLPIQDIGGGRGVNLNDIWGWEDPQTGREYALVGRTNGTSFVDITDASNPRYLGDLPMTEGARANAWRDIKVYRDHAYIVADGSGQHGMQVFDLTRLRNVPNAPATFAADTVYPRIGSAHNIVINEETGTAYAVGVNSGGDVCGGGLHMIDIREPKVPKFIGCFADPRTGNAGTGYSHDAQCVTYAGPDEKYRGREICIGSNETAISIADVTDRDSTVALSRASYPNVQYAHQGWLTEDHRFFYMNDEGDEGAGVVEKTRTVIWDLSDLDDPIFVGEFLGVTGAIDHNLYVKGDTMFQSNYTSGLRVIDISNRQEPREIGFFDTVPGTDDAEFRGSWSNYPYFKSGTIIFTSIGEGLFVVKMRRPIS